MSYYSRNYHDTDHSWLTIIICFALILFIIFTHNACTAQDWNDGECPKCEVRYELRGASRGLKYYSCPKCGKEVERY